MGVENSPHISQYTVYDSGSSQMSDDPSIHSYLNIFKNCLESCEREQNL